MTKKRSKRPPKTTIMDKITADDAHYVLGVLIKEDAQLAERVEKIVRSRMSNVDRETVAQDVLSCLDELEAEDIWDRSGNTKGGYVDPSEAAFLVVDDALDPFDDQLRQYMKMSMWNDAKDYCLGFLLGIYRFVKGESSLFKEHAVDVPEQYSSWIEEEWKKKCKDAKVLEDFADEYAELFPDW